MARAQGMVAAGVGGREVSRRDYYTLADLQGRLTLLEVRCRRCERHGRLVAEHGPAAGCRGWIAPAMATEGGNTD